MAQRKQAGRPAAGLEWVGVAVTIAGILLAAAIVLAIPDLRHGVSSAIHGDTTAVRNEVDGLGAAGVAVVAALALIHTVVWYPAEILDAATGYVYGFGPGLALVMACWLGSGLVAYWIGGAAGRPLLYRFAGEERFRRGEHLVQSGGVSFLIGIRLIPIVPFSLMSMACGAARVPIPRFLWTTAVGYLPITAVFVYLGSRLETLSATDPLLIAGAIVVVVLLAATRWISLRVAGRDAGRQPH